MTALGTLAVGALVVLTLMALAGFAAAGLVLLAVLVVATGLWPLALAFIAGAVSSALVLVVLMVRRDERALWNETTARAFADAGDRLVDELDQVTHRYVPGRAS